MWSEKTLLKMVITFVNSNEAFIYFRAQVYLNIIGLTTEQSVK